MSITAQTLIGQALRSIGAIASGEPLVASEAQDALTALNQMVRGFAKHRQAVLYTARNTYTLTAATQTYQIGVGAAAPGFAQTRPVYLSDVGLLLVASPTIETLLEPMTEDEWARESLKSQSGSPSKYIYRKAYPYGLLTFWPVPDAADTVALYGLTPLTEFADLTTAYDLDEGWDEALRYNLAVRLCPEFGRPLDATVAALAVETLATVKRANVEERLMAIDDALLEYSGGFDITTGQ